MLLLSNAQLSSFPGCAAAIILAAGSSSAVAQSTQIQTLPDVVNLASLREQAKPLLVNAKAGDGSAGISLQNYNGHHTMLTVRTASGRAEQHMHFADFLLVLEGEGTELTGGTIQNLVQGPDGENKGTKLEGAIAHALHAGDVMHIPAGVPHQAIEESGQSIVVYVIKVEEPAK